MSVQQLSMTGLPRSFRPPGDRGARLAHLDPRPLGRPPACGPSPLRSPTFWLAGVLVLPCAAVVAMARGAARLVRI